MAKTLKKWQGWVLFLGSMAVVFVLGLLVSSLMERRAEVASVFNNKRTVFEDSIVPRMRSSRLTIRVSTRRGQRPRTPRSSRSTTVQRRLTCSSSVQRWWCCGPAMLSRATTTRLADISTLWRICVRFCARAIRVSMATVICSRLPAGRVRVLMCLV